MNTEALTMMAVTQIIFVAATIYFFIKVLRVKPKEEEPEE